MSLLQDGLYQNAMFQKPGITTSEKWYQIPGSGSITIPENVSRIYVELVGGGQHGEATFLTGNYDEGGGASGSGGGYAADFFDVVSGQIYDYFIGHGGQTNYAFSDDSYFVSGGGSFITSICKVSGRTGYATFNATGGAGGASDAVAPYTTVGGGGAAGRLGNGAGPVARNNGTGGIAVAGLGEYPGGDGGVGYPLNNPVFPAYDAGDGSPGQNYGGGGGGAGGRGPSGIQWQGGVGMRGVMIITYYYS